MTRRRRRCATASDIGMEHTAIGQDIAGLLHRGRHAGQQRRRQPDPGPAARNVQGVQRIRARTGAADPVVAAADRRGQRELRADHAADRPGRARSWTRRSAAATTSGRSPTGWPGSPAKSPTPTRSCVRCCRPCPARPRRPNDTFAGIRPDVPDAGRQPGQLRSHRRDLQQVDRAGAGDLPRPDGRAASPSAADCPRTRAASWTSRSTCRIRRRCSTGFIPPPLIRSPADTTLRELPTDLYCKTCRRTIPAWCAVRATTRARSSPASGRPTIQLCRDPRGLRADRQQPVARPAGARTAAPINGSAEHPAAEQVPVHSAAGGSGSGTTGRCSCRPGCRRVPGPRRTRRSRCRCRRTSLASRRRRGRSSRRRIRWCRRTAGRRRRRRRRPAACRRPAAARGGRRCPPRDATR